MKPYVWKTHGLKTEKTEREESECGSSGLPEEVGSMGLSWLAISGTVGGAPKSWGGRRWLAENQAHACEFFLSV